MIAAVLAAAALGCQTAEVRTHNEAVFGRFATLAAARAFAKKPRALRFRGIKIEADGCGEFEVEIDGADTEKDRQSFAAEAAKSRFWITFEQRGDPLSPPHGQVYGVLGRFATVKAANAYSWNLVRAGYRYTELVPIGRKWAVVMPQVPVRNALAIAREAAKAGYHIQFSTPK